MDLLESLFEYFSDHYVRCYISSPFAHALIMVYFSKSAKQELKLKDSNPKVKKEYEKCISSKQTSSFSFNFFIGNNSSEQCISHRGKPVVHLPSNKLCVHSPPFDLFDGNMAIKEDLIQLVLNKRLEAMESKHLQVAGIKPSKL